MLMPLEAPTRERTVPAWKPTERPRTPELPLIEVAPNRLVRIVDVVLVLLILLAAWPLILVGMLLVWVSSRGPVLYSQTRLGLRGKPFSIYKIRTMHNDCELLSGPAWSTSGDPRIFPVGRWLRRTHVDELPQLWNILIGDMSLVGPRPERPEFIPQLERVIPGYRQRLLVLPGLTGLAQVNLPPDSNLDSVRRKLAFDLYYVRRRSVWLGLRIIAATFLKLVLPGGVPHRLFGFPTQHRVDDEYGRLTANAFGTL